MKTWTAVLLALGLSAQLAISPAAGAVAEQGCSRAHVKRLIKAFVSAHNDGNLRRLDRIFATERFGWYSVGPLERTGYFAQDRRTLIDYFAERRSWGDKIELTTLKVNTTPNDDGTWGFGFELQRSSSHPLPTSSGTFSGKGGASCQLRSWHMFWSP